MSSDETGDSRSSTDEWREHNEGFQYEPPDGSPEGWSRDEFTKLYDRVISRHVRWECQKCSKPFGSLEKARRHVEHQHSERLIDGAVARQNDDD